MVRLGPWSHSQVSLAPEVKRRATAAELLNSTWVRGATVLPPATPPPVSRLLQRTAIPTLGEAANAPLARGKSCAKLAAVSMNEHGPHAHSRSRWLRAEAETAASHLEPAGRLQRAGTTWGSGLSSLAGKETWQSSGSMATFSSDNTRSMTEGHPRASGQTTALPPLPRQRSSGAVTWLRMSMGQHARSTPQLPLPASPPQLPLSSSPPQLTPQPTPQPTPQLMPVEPMSLLEWAIQEELHTQEAGAADALRKVTFERISLDSPYRPPPPRAPRLRTSIDLPPEPRPPATPQPGKFGRRRSWWGNPSRVVQLLKRGSLDSPVVMGGPWQHGSGAAGCGA